MKKILITLLKIAAKIVDILFFAPKVQLFFTRKVVVNICKKINQLDNKLIK